MAKDPGVQVEETQSVHKSSSKKNKKNKKHCRGGEEDAGNAASVGEAPARKKAQAPTVYHGSLLNH